MDTRDTSLELVGGSHPRHQPEEAQELETLNVQSQVARAQPMLRPSGAVTELGRRAHRKREGSRQELPRTDRLSEFDTHQLGLKGLEVDSHTD